MDSPSDEKPPLRDPVWLALRRQRIGAVVIVLVLLGGALLVVRSVRGTPERRATERIATIESLFVDGEFESAAAALEESLAGAPDHALSLALLGEVRLRQERTAEGVDLLRRALRIDPRMGTARIALAEQLAENGELRAALAQLDSALAIDTKNHRARRLRVDLRGQSGAVQGLIDDLELLAREGGASSALNTALTLRFFAGLTRDRSFGEHSDEWAQRALARSVAGNVLPDLEASILGANGRHVEALEVLARSPADGPETLAVATTRAAALVGVGLGDEAVALLQRRLAAGPDDVATGLLARVLIAEGDLRTAAAVLATRSSTGAQSVLLRRDLTVAGLATKRPFDPVVALVVPRGVPVVFAREPLVASVHQPGDDPLAALSRAAIGVPLALASARGADDPSPEHAGIAADLASARAAYPGPTAFWSAILAISAGDLDVALEQAVLAVEHHESVEGTRHLLAVVHLLREEWTDAATAARASLESEGPTAARVALAVACIAQSGDPLAAVALGRAGLVDHPTDGRISRAILDALGDGAQRRTGEMAILHAQAALAGGDIAAAAAMAEWYRGRPEPAAPHDELSRAIWRRVAEEWSVAPDAAVESVLRHAFALERSGRPRRAVQFLADALRHSEDGELRLAHATTLGRAGRFPAALRALEPLRGDRLVGRRATLLRARLRAATDGPAAARDDLVECLRDDRGSATGVTAARELLAWAEPPAASIDAVLDWLGGAEDLGAVERSLIECYLAAARGDLDDAGARARALADAPDPPPHSHLLLGTVRLRQGDLEGARDALVRAAVAMPWQRVAGRLLAETRRALAVAALQDGRARDAQRELVHVLAGPHASVGAAALLHGTLALPGATDELGLAAQLDAANGRFGGAVFRALTALRRGDWEQASNDLDRALDERPADTEVLALAVDTALAGGGHARIDRLANAALAAGAPLNAVETVHGRALLANGESKRAAAAARRAFAAAPHDLRAAELLVSCVSSDEREVTEVIGRFGDGVESPAYTAVRAGLWAISGRPERALPLLETALRTTPDSAELLTVRAEIHLAAGRLSEALGDAERALLLNAESTQLRIFRGSLLYRVKGAAAESILREEAEARPLDSAAWTTLAQVVAAQRGSKSAVPLYERAIRVDPAATLARNNLAWTLGVDLGRPADGLDVLAPARAEHPMDADIADTFGWLCHLDDRPDEALRALDVAVRKPDAPPEFHERRAAVLTRLGRTEEAARATAEAERLRRDR